MHKLSLQWPALIAASIASSYPLELAAEAPARQAQSQQESSITLDIPAQSLARSLIQLGKSQNISIVFPTQLLNGKQGPAIKGQFSINGALNALLKESGIEHLALSPKVIRLKASGEIEQANEAPFQYGPMEEISVIGRPLTGSRLKRHDLNGSAPVDIISAPQIAELGVQSVGELLKFMPAVSGNSTSTSIGNGGDGTATVTLRGLPASNTLVLINGHRIANSGFAGEAVDLNSISTDSIERIEILKGGGSAVYGSDAIAGVVNINLKKEYSGASFNQYYGQSSRGGLGSLNSNLTLGKDFDKGNALLILSHQQRDPIFSRDRELSASADGRPFGGSDSRSSATPGGRFTLSDGSVVTYDKQLEDFRPATSEDLYNFAEQTSAVSESSQDAIYGFANWQLSDQIELAIDLAYTRSKAEATLASTPIFTAFSQEDATISKDNIYNPFGEDISDARYRALEAGPRLQNDDSKSYRSNLQLDGNWQQLNWSTQWNWSRNESSETLTGIFDGARLQRALGPSSQCQGANIDGCVPLDLFSGNIPQDQIGYIRTQSSASGFTELNEFSATLSGNLNISPAGTSQALGGLSYRTEKTKFLSENSESFFVGGSVLGDTAGERQVKEAFFELFVPLAKPSKWVNMLDIEFAVRHSSFSDFGKNTSPKTGIRYRPNNDILFRASYAEGFRAPSLQELHAGRTASFLTLNDPCSNPDNIATLPGCQQTSDPSLNQFLTLKKGNTELKAELADTSTIGFVWTPRAISKLFLSIDYFDISQRNVVDSSAQFIINQNAQFAHFSDLIERDSAGNIRQVIAPNLNIGRRNIGGLDIQLHYRTLPMLGGHVDLSLNAAHIYRYQEQISPEQSSENLAGTFRDEASEGNGALPKWKVSTGIRYKKSRWQLNYNIHYVSPVEEVLMDSQEFRKTASWLNQNLQFSYDFSQKMRLSLGVDNIFDQSPPFFDSAFLDNHDARTYDIKGRFWYTRFNYHFM
ncbi:TonB-dependent receptor [uncultured Pseudoteredinibacter sp.]|uniref:TonB-dependent receptor n=1 Tax=uncultured Pseudoteredinibacter sp. TaxID=1641701 RepID=UPI00261F3722|nr:TonB-dependent receptor [uncultured Pseudoteredinibacter sp.]